MLSIDQTPVDLKSCGTELTRVNVPELIGNAKHSVVRATWGAGKTSSLVNNKDLASSALFASPRLCINADIKGFKNVLTINGVANNKGLDLSEYAVIVFDECVLCLDVLLWEAVNFKQFVHRLQGFEGRIICLDAEATDKTAELWSKIIGQPVEFFEHKTDKRNKLVGFTRDISNIQEQAIAHKTGIKLIIGDQAKLLKHYYDTWGVGDDAKKFYICGDNSSEARKVLDEAAECDNAWIFASPCLQEGISIEYTNCVYTAYVHKGNSKDFLRPIDKGMQAIHRVRNKFAEINVCLLEWLKEEPTDEEAELYSLVEEFASYKKLDKEFKHFLYTRGVKPPMADFLMAEGEDWRQIAFTIYAHHRAITTVQNGDAKAEWQKALEKAGYEVFNLDETDFVLPELEPPLEPDICEVLADYVQSVPYDERIVDFLYTRYDRADIVAERFGWATDATSRFVKRRVLAGKYYGIGKANDAEFLAEWPKHIKRAKTLEAFKFLEFGEFITGSAFDYKMKPKLAIVHALLQQVMGKEQWQAFGTRLDVPYITIELNTLYNHELYSKVKQMWKAEKAKDNRWFWQKCLGKMLGFEYERVGQSTNYKYRIANDILLHNSLTKPAIHGINLV